mmetsp:Transcript_3364/g.12788  ORF Transcript_3364/g.12788 Transcript_3364/m.12788 type:complete len:106 (+) Transcript_3364:294-611(+)
MRASLIFKQSAITIFVWSAIMDCTFHTVRKSFSNVHDSIVSFLCGQQEPTKSPYQIIGILGRRAPHPRDTFLEESESALQSDRPTLAEYRRISVEGEGQKSRRIE